MLPVRRESAICGARTFSSKGYFSEEDGGLKIQADIWWHGGSLILRSIVSYEVGGLRFIYVGYFNPNLWLISGSNASLHSHFLNGFFIIIVSSLSPFLQ